VRARLDEFVGFVRRPNVVVPLGAFALALAGFDFLQEIAAVVVGAIQTPIGLYEGTQFLIGDPLSFDIWGRYVNIAGLVASGMTLLAVGLVVAFLARWSRGRG